MADERDLELLDDYLTNRMGEQNRSAFEQRIQADPDLLNEYTLQRRLIKGIKDARVSQLKSMLNQVPVPAHNTGSALASKIIFGAVVTIMVAATVWYFTRTNAQQAEQQAISQQNATPDEQVTTESESLSKEFEASEPDVVQDQVIESDKNQTSAGTEHSKPSQARRPDPVQAPGAADAESPRAKDPAIDVFNPEADETKSNPSRNDNQPVYKPGTSSLVVETDRNNRRYTFHYQFKEGKLFLYGPLEKNLYEIMEFFTDEKRTVFLYYKDQYYLLEEGDANIRPLTPISDQALIKKLREYRRSK